MEGSPEEGQAPATALAAVLKHSAALPPESAQVRGYDFDRGVDYRALMEAYGTTGFQATNFRRAVQQVNAMVRPGRDFRRGGVASGRRAGGAWPIRPRSNGRVWAGPRVRTRRSA